MSDNKNNSVIAFDIDKLQVWAKRGKDFILNSEFELDLQSFLGFRKQVEAFYALIRAKIEQDGTELMGEHFKGFKGDHTTANYQFTGGQAEFIAHDIEQIDPQFTQIVVKLDSKTIKAYEKQHGELPAGIVRADRKKSIVIRTSVDKKE